MNNKTKISLAILTAIVLPLQIMAVDLGVAGAISVWNQNDSGTGSGVSDLRLKVSESLNSSTKLNVVADATSTFYIKEGYLTFSKPLDVLGLNYNITGLEVVAGQKLISFGRDNARYTEDRAFVSRSTAVSGLLGNGLVGKGIEASYTLPVSLPIKLTAGYALDTVVGGETMRTNATSLRAALTQKSYSIGASALMADNGDDTDAYYGVDGSYTRDLGMGAFKAEAEFIKYSPEDDSIECQTGYYAYAGYDWKNSWTTGVLYDALSSDTSGGDDYTSMGLVVTRELSKSAKLRAQFMSNNNETDDSAIYAQIVFNLK